MTRVHRAARLSMLCAGIGMCALWRERDAVLVGDKHTRMQPRPARPIHRCSAIPQTVWQAWSCQEPVASERSHGNLACLASHRATDFVSPDTRRCSRGDAGSMGPSSLPGSITIIDRSADQGRALRCHTQRVQPAAVDSEGRQIGLTSQGLRPLPAQRHAAQRAAGVAAWRRAPGGSVLPIGGARTLPHATSTVAVTIFPSFRRRGSSA